MALHHHFTETQLPQQRNYNSTPFPSVLSPTPNSPTCSVSHLIQTITTQKQFLDSLLHKTGAILFRGFDVNTAKDFNDVVEAFGYEEYSPLGVTALRSQVFGRVYTANESSTEQKINFHHEMPMAPQFPSKLFFFCELEPTSGGETPIVLSHIVYEKMKRNHPEFVSKLEKHGLTMTRFLHDYDNLASAYGRSWKSMFSTEDRTVAEERAAKMGSKLEWVEGGVKRIIPDAAIYYDESRQRKIWFTSTVGWDNAGNDPDNLITFGDGSPLPADGCKDCLRILEEECVVIPWRKGDILLIDNVAVLHGRRPTKSPRRVLASLCK